MRNFFEKLLRTVLIFPRSLKVSKTSSFLSIRLIVPFIRSNFLKSPKFSVTNFLKFAIVCLSVKLSRAKKEIFKFSDFLRMCINSGCGYFLNKTKVLYILKTASLLKWTNVTKYLYKLGWSRSSLDQNRAVIFRRLPSLIQKPGTRQDTLLHSLNNRNFDKKLKFW